MSFFESVSGSDDVIDNAYDRFVDNGINITKVDMSNEIMIIIIILYLIMNGSDFVFFWLSKGWSDLPYAPYFSCCTHDIL